MIDGRYRRAAVVGAAIAAIAPVGAMGGEPCAAASVASTVSLPKPAFRGVAVEEAIAARRTTRQYGEIALTLAQLSQLLWAAQGITDSGSGRRAAPSAGSTYPIDLYLVPNRVEGLTCGVYRYRPDRHALELHLGVGLRQDLSEAAPKQPWLHSAGVVIAFVAYRGRVAPRFGDENALKSILLEAGHISQNIYLQAASMGLGAGAVGGYSEPRMHRALGLGPDAQVVYLNHAGRKD